MKTIHNLLAIATLLASAPIVPADVPSSINYQGRLTNAAGVPQPGTRTMSVKIYDAATAGTQLYTESIGNVTVDANGVYSFQFGAAGISEALAAGAEHWLELTVDGVAQSPRQKLLAVPFAMKSATAEHATFADGATVNVSGYQELSSDVTYQAPASGFIIASRKDMRELPSNATLSVRVGPTATSLVEITAGNYERSTVGVQQTVPIKKGFYWRAEGFGKVFFVSFE